MGTTPVNHIENNTRAVPIQFHRNEWTVIIHSSATVIQFSIQQFFKRTYALKNKSAAHPIGYISLDNQWIGCSHYYLFNIHYYIITIQFIPEDYHYCYFKYYHYCYHCYIIYYTHYLIYIYSAQDKWAQLRYNIYSIIPKPCPYKSAYND